MDDSILIVSEDSENSITEVVVPKKRTPPLIEIEEEEIILNISGKSDKSILAKDFIDQDKKFSDMEESPQCLISPNHWTTDMIKFYNDDWGNEEQFVVEKIQEKMDKTPFLWKVSRKDILNTRNKFRKSNTKCWNCNQQGHHFSFCQNQPHVPKCHMCGTGGHMEYACPDSKCLNCGNYSREFVTCCYKCRHEVNEVCSRCSAVGHNFINCPDHWRLFHITTGTTSVVIPSKNVYKLINDIWCCNCGKKGHYQNQCQQRKDCSIFKDTLPYVASYQKAFNDSQPLSDAPIRKHKRNQKYKDKLEKAFQLNPINKAIRKDKIFFKNKLRRFKKFKKSRRKKKKSKDFWNIITF